MVCIKLPAIECLKLTEIRNAPWILGMRSILYPLAAGNTCILKGSEYVERMAESESIWWLI